jgi:hypothetical protein
VSDQSIPADGRLEILDGTVEVNSRKVAIGKPTFL